ILGFSELIYRSPRLYGLNDWPEPFMRDMVQVQRNAAYLSDLVNDIVDIARVDALAMPTRRESTDLRVVADEALRTVASLAVEKGIALEQRLPPNLPNLLIDPVRIRQVLFNLLTNAIRFTDVGRVSVLARLDGAEVVVTVRDTGRGIPANQLEAIFDEYRQLGRPRDGSDPGKGLGLAIAKRFVQLHGGRIWVESEEGTGSAFSFALPLQSRPTVRPAFSGPVQQRASQSRPKVVVLDEGGIATAYLRRQLDEYEFQQSPGWEEAARLMRETHPVALIENVPPNEGQRVPVQGPASGLPTGMPLIRCSLPSTQWISGHEMFAAVLAKPVSAATLVGTLRQLLPETGCDPHVLVVDDDRGFVQLIARILQAEGGFSVATGYNGEDALRKARRRRPDIVLLDLVMPEIGGLELAERMRSDPVLASVLLVAVTAASPGEDDLETRGSSFSLFERGARGQGTLLALLGTALTAASRRASGQPYSDAAPTAALPGTPAS
ncbi:MAG: ATP-binding response regulator, partial [Anaerolineae bacterium]